MDRLRWSDMDKRWYMSNGIRGGLLVIFGGVLTAVGKLLQGDLDYSAFFSQIVPLLGTGLGIIGIRVRIK